MTNKPKKPQPDFGPEAIAALVMLCIPEFAPPPEYIKEAERIIDQRLPEGLEKYNFSLRQNARVALASLGGVQNRLEVKEFIDTVNQMIVDHEERKIKAEEMKSEVKDDLSLEHLLDELHSAISQAGNLHVRLPRIDADEYAYLKHGLRIEANVPPSIDAFVSRMNFAGIDSDDCVIRQTGVRGDFNYIRIDMPDALSEEMTKLLKEQGLKSQPYRSLVPGTTSIRVDLRPLARDPEASRHSARVIARALDNPSSGFHRA